MKDYRQDHPLITIVTVVYNAEHEIAKTIESVLSLKTAAVEYIVLDGDSSDNTLHVINQYGNSIDLIIREKDEGIYDAMNKGIAHSTGDYIYFINAGDIMLHLPVDLITSTDSDLVLFPVKTSDHNVRHPKWNNWLKIRNTIPHQGCFYKNTEMLIYKTKYKVFADFDLNQRYYKAKKTAVIHDAPIMASHDLSGISHDRKYGKEIFIVVQDNFGLTFKILSLLYFRLNGLLHRIKNVFPQKIVMP